MYTSYIMPGDITPSPNDELKQLLLEHTRLLKAIHVSTEKTRRYILWNQVWSFVKIIVIVASLMFGYMFIQPYLKQMIVTYQDLLGGASSAPATPSGAKQITVPQNIWDQLMRSGVLPATTK